MRLSIAIAAGVVALGSRAGQRRRRRQSSPPPQIETHHDFSAAKRSKKRVRRPPGLRRSGQQIACTQLGCNPIPRGCRVEPGRIPFTWDPSGFDEVQCPT